MSKTIRIFIADDHAVVLHGLALVLRQEPGFQVVGQARNGAEAVSMILDTVPHVALLDWKMPKMDGIEAAKAIKQNMVSVRTLLMTGFAIETAVLDAINIVLDGCIHKETAPADMIYAIRQVANGQTYISPQVTQALIERSRQSEAYPNPVPLTPRETEVLELMATSLTYQEIATQLGIGKTTVSTHVKHILAKLSQPNRTQAVITALRLNLLSFNKTN